VLGSIGIYVVAYLPLKKENKKRENDKKWQKYICFMDSYLCS
jgi:hypothetical protein